MGAPPRVEILAPLNSPGLRSVASRQEGIFPKRNRFIRLFFRWVSNAAEKWQTPARAPACLRPNPDVPPHALGGPPSRRWPALAGTARAFPSPEKKTQILFAKSNKDRSRGCLPGLVVDAGSLRAQPLL
jgi:hypothetical protein